MSNVLIFFGGWMGRRSLDELVETAMARGLLTGRGLVNAFEEVSFEEVLRLVVTTTPADLLGDRPGSTLTQNNRHGETTSAFTAFKNISGLFKGGDILALNPALSDSSTNPAVDAGLNFLRRRTDRRGKLVVYGFSAGGFNALRLCQRIAGLSERGLPRRTNLLITVDPCLQLLRGHEHFSTRTPPHVEEHINFYQTIEPVDGGFRGCSMPGAVPDQPISKPSNLDENQMHNRMPIITLPEVRRRIQMALHSQVDAWRPA